MAPVALAFAVLELDGTATDLGLVLTAAMLARIALILAGGVVSDRLPRSAVMIGSNLASGLAQLALAALLLAGQAELWHVGVLAVAAAGSSAFFFPASQGVVPLTVPAAELQQANAVLRLALNSTQIAGAAAGGVLVATVGVGWAFAFDGATYLAAAAILLAMRLPHVRRDPAAHFVGDLLRGWHEFASRRWLWVVVLGFGFSNAASAAAFGVLGPVVARDSLGGAGAWGLVLAAQAAGLVLGSLAGLRLRPRHPLLVGVSLMTLTVPPLALLALEAPVGLLAVSALFSGIAIDLFTVYWDTALQGHVPVDRLSRVAAWDALGSWVLMPIGFAVVGPLSAAIGIEATLWAAAAIVVAAMLGQLAVRDVRTLPRPG